VIKDLGVTIPHSGLRTKVSREKAKEIIVSPSHTVGLEPYTWTIERVLEFLVSIPHGGLRTPVLLKVSFPYNRLHPTRWA